jgi:hypothetical protein
MKSTVFVLMVAALALVATAASAGTASGPGPGYKLIMEPPTPPGDGTPNLLGFDDDGDGIPNGQDPDYVPPADGTGRKFGTSSMEPQGPVAQIQNWFRSRFQQWFGIDLSLSGYGPGDGTGNGGVGPKDGTGYGPGPRGDGECDGGGEEFLLRRMR